jgi:hypothetical protein
MKNFFLSIFAGILFLLTGCLETTQEITINGDGSGTITNTNDMSSLLAMAKQMGGATEMEKAGDQKIDSTISLSEGLDSISNLSPEEKVLVAKGILKVNMDLKNEKFITSIIFPFASPTEIATLNSLSGKIMTETINGKMKGDAAPTGLEGMPTPSSFDDYYFFKFSEGELKKSLNKEKYTSAESDEYLKGMKEAGAMGMTMKTNYIINLPRAAKQAEGKGIKLSEDKMKVTISVDINDFFSDPSLLEFRIKY